MAPLVLLTSVITLGFSTWGHAQTPSSPATPQPVSTHPPEGVPDYLRTTKLGTITLDSLLREHFPEDYPTGSITSDDIVTISAVNSTLANRTSLSTEIVRNDDLRATTSNGESVPPDGYQQSTIPNIQPGGNITQTYRVIVVHPKDQAGLLSASAYTRVMRIPLIVTASLTDAKVHERLQVMRPSDIFVVGGPQRFPDSDLGALQKYLGEGGIVDDPDELIMAPTGLKRIFIDGESSDIAVAEMLFSALRPRVAVVLSESSTAEKRQVLGSLDVSALAAAPIYIDSGSEHTRSSIARGAFNGLIDDQLDPALDGLLNGNDSLRLEVQGVQRDSQRLSTRDLEVAPREGVRLGAFKYEEVYQLLQRGERVTLSDNDEVCRFYGTPQMMGIDSAQEVRMVEVGRR